MPIDWLYRGKIISSGIHRTPEFDYEIVKHPGAVTLIPIADNGDIVFVEQYRHAVGRHLLELPAGCLEEGEEPHSAAQRELREEIGHRAGRLTPLTSFFPSPGFCNEHVHIYLAEELAHDPLIAEDTHSIRVVSLPFNEALQRVLDGNIQDAKTIMGVLLYNQRRGHA
jgi:ADP-ribose pyrophosphatase